MTRYLMLGKYSLEGIKGIAAPRTKAVTLAIEKAGGKVLAMYVLLGAFDLAFVVEFAGNAEVMKASVEIAKLTGITFTTSPAMTVDEFDRYIG